MGGRTAPDEHTGTVFESKVPPPPLGTTIGLGLLVFLALLSNGRPIGAGDTRPTEHVAKSLVERGRLDLDGAPEVEPPFARLVRGHRVSIYPVLSAVMAAPVFALARLLFELDETGSALAGKVAASLFSAIAAALLFVPLARRYGETRGALAAALFALGTSVFSTSQALWQHPAAVLFLSWALLWIDKAADDSAWASWAGLPLGLALAARHADCALVAVFALGVILAWPKRTLGLLLLALPPVAFVCFYDTYYFGSPWSQGFSGSLARFDEPWGLGQLGLLVSPGKGLFVFTPLALVAVAGLVRAFLRGERLLAGTLGAASLAHLLLIGRWSEWHGGESFGPRMMTDVLPLLFFFLPEGLALLGKLGLLLAGFSVFVQVLGAFAFDDYRWERLYQRPPAPGHPELWSLAESPILYYAERRVFILSLPLLERGRVFIRESPFVAFGPKGSRVRFSGDGVEVRGADPTFSDCYLQYGARVRDRHLQLSGRWDGLFLRILPEARIRPLELRVLGRGKGILYVGEKTFWSAAPVWKAYSVNGAFRIVHPYFFPESGGGDIVVTVGKGGGDASLDLVALVTRAEPDQPIEAP